MYDELYHFGVKGMKWGVRKNPSKAYYKALKKDKALRDDVKKHRDAATKAKVKSENAEAELKKLNKKTKALERERDRQRDIHENYEKIHDDSKSDTIFGSLNKMGFEYSKNRMEVAEKNYDDHMDKVWSNTINKKVGDSEVRYHSAKAKKVLSKSRQWKDTMNKTFANVSESDIRAGQAMYEEWLRSRR